MADDRQLTPINDYDDATRSSRNGEDFRTDDYDYDPTLEPREAKAWLNRLEESEDAFHDYNVHCDRIDEQYASLSRLSALNRDPQFQMFWANAEVLKPSIYARKPIPVVVPKFDRTPVYQAASELLERCNVVSFDLTDIDELMKLVRDDLALIDRGIAWLRYEGPEGDRPERVVVDFKSRRDFLHSVSRNWREVSWVAAASYLTRSQARARFRKHSGDEFLNVAYRVDKDSNRVGGADERERGKFWEIWSRAENRVIWVAEGCQYMLDDAKPHLKLRNFFPCPKPAYGTTQRNSLVPVPDVLQYRDQLEELNMLTGRIHALSDALEAKGFYPGGGGEVADAINTAISIKAPGRVLVPISNWATFGGSKEVIIWLPIDMIAQVVTALVQLRQQIIQDIYQIMGLSDIMRGSTSPEETLGAQQLKTQYGSVRIRDKQEEMVRLARDIVEMSSEIMLDKFDDTTLIEMSQTTLPTNADIQKQVDQIGQQVRQAQQQLMMSQGPGQPPNPQAQQQLQDLTQQAYQKIGELAEKPTIEQVLRFLHDNKARAFTLDIETDSTIAPDEQREKEQVTEFIGMFAQLIPQLSALMSADPAYATFCGELLKFTIAPFRAGRTMQGAIDDFVNLVKAKANQPRGDDPATLQSKTALQVEKMRMDAKTAHDQGQLAIQKAELDQKDRHQQQQLALEQASKAADLQADNQADQAKAQQLNQKAMADREAHQMDMVAKQQDIRANLIKSQLQAQHQNRQMQLREQDAQRRQAIEQFKLTNRGFMGGGNGGGTQ